MVKYLVMDVDGTLTDGKIYMGQEGEQIKAFDIKDGCGILLVLPEYSIEPIIITARKSKILENRCRELNIQRLHQGIKDKLSILRNIVGDDLSSVAYVGDDLPDIPCMEAVKKDGGFVLCPSDAIQEVKMLSDYVSGNKAGQGAIRDCINYLIHYDNKNISERIKIILEWIQAGNYKDGFFPDGTAYTIQEYKTKAESECILESHRKHIDIQYMISGHELFRIYNSTGLTSTGRYDEMTDKEYWQSGVCSSINLLVPGSIVVVRENQPHKGAIAIDTSERIIKLVCKLEV